MNNLNSLLMVLLFTSVAAFAKEPQKPKSEAPDDKGYASLLLGDVTSLKSSGGSHFGYSGRVGTNFYHDDSGDLAIGLFVGRFTDSQTVGSISASESDTALLPEFVCRNAWGSGAYFGARAGIVFVNASVSAPGVNASGTASSFAIGPVVGYEAPMTKKISLTGDVSVLSVSGGSVNLGTLGDVKYDAMGALTIQGGVTFHF